VLEGSFRKNPVIILLKTVKNTVLLQKLTVILTKA